MQLGIHNSLAAASTSADVLALLSTYLRPDGVSTYFQPTGGFLYTTT